MWDWERKILRVRKVSDSRISVICTEGWKVANEVKINYTLNGIYPVFMFKNCVFKRELAFCGWILSFTFIKEKCKLDLLGPWQGC